MSWSAHLPRRADRAAARRRRADAAARRAPRSGSRQRSAWSRARPAARRGARAAARSPTRPARAGLRARQLAGAVRHRAGGRPAVGRSWCCSAACSASPPLVFSLARWHRAGPRFHSLLQFLLMGLNGAFLTGDLFNLFVFFELLLAASYGLALHGSGTARVRSGLHYIVINLAASLLFLIGVSLIYGVTGTLNMADLAQRIPLVAADDRALVRGRRGGARHRLPGQGRHVAARLLAAVDLRGGERAGGGAVRDPDQGRRLRGAAALAAAVRRRRGRPSCCSSAAWRRSSSARSACSRRRSSGGSPATACCVSSGTLLAAISRGDGARDRRARCSTWSPRRSASRRLLPADRAGAARARARRRRAGGDCRGLRPRRRGRGAGRAARHGDPGRHGAARPELRCAAR